MGKKLEKNKEGQTPLSPKSQEVFDELKRVMGADWHSWPKMEGILHSLIDDRCLNYMAPSTFRQRINQMTARGWVETKRDLYDGSQRTRLFYRIVNGKVMVFCASCEELREAADELDFLCGECRELS